MSQRNVEIVRRMYEAFGRGDAEAALASLDPSVVMDATHRVDGRIGRGHQQVAVAMLYELRNGKVIRWTIYNDRSEALEAAGFSE